MKIDPGLARNFFLSIREGSRDDLEYQKLLVNPQIDRIFLYDDRFDIFLNNSDRKGKVFDYEAADIEKYFDNSPGSSSITLMSGGMLFSPHPYRGAVKGGSEIVEAITERISRPLTVTLPSRGHC